MIRRGEEVYNSYGENMGDGRLLTEWGFVEEDSTGGLITFDIEEMGAGARKWMQMAQGGEMGWVDDIGIDDEDEQLIDLPPNDRPLGLTLDTEGVLSIHVFAIVYLDQPALQTGVTVRAAVEELRNAWMASEDENFDEPIEMKSSTFEAVTRIYQLLDKRLNSLNRSHLPMEDLYQLRDVSEPYSKCS